MLEFPVNVSKSDAGDYVARLVDVPDGPAGTGVDPYSALDNLKDVAVNTLSTLKEEGRLPTPSPVDDRPVVSFEENAAASPPSTPEPLATGKGDQSEMIGYSWTNHAVFADNLGSTK